MKQNRKKRWILLEGIGELCFTLLFLGIGILIVSLFGVDFESPDIDYDLIILLGLIAFAVLFGIVYAFVQWLKKIVKGRRK